MTLALRGLRLIIGRKDSIVVMILGALLFLLSLFLVINGRVAFDVFTFDQLPAVQQYLLFLSLFFDITSAFTPFTFFVAFLGSLLGGVNMSLAYTYMELRGSAIIKSNLVTGIGLVAAFLGIGCAACGTALLSVLLGVFGFSALLAALPYGGQEVGVVGLLFLLIATYSLSRKVAAPNVC